MTRIQTPKARGEGTHPAIKFWKGKILDSTSSKW